MNISILDIEAGNIRSVENFFSKNFEHSTKIIPYKNLDLSKDDLLVIPGVGNFGFVGNKFHENDTFEKLKRFNNSGKLIIGICLGAQFLTSGSEEAPNVSGLGFIKGKCKSLLKHPEYKGRVPRVGWSALRSSIYERHSFYFVHSFYMDIEDDNRNTKIELCSDGVTAMVEQQNLLAMQFHPEKSNSSGLSIVKSFIERNA